LTDIETGFKLPLGVFHLFSMFTWYSISLPNFSFLSDQDIYQTLYLYPY